MSSGSRRRHIAPLSLRFRPLLVTGLVLAFLSSGCCSRRKPKGKPPSRATLVVKVQPTKGQPKQLRAQLRVTYSERGAPIGRLGSSGLMFVYPRARSLGASLATAAAPVDVVLIAPDRRVLRVVAKTRATVTAAPRLHRYALLLPANHADGLGLTAGARVSFELPARAQPARTLTPVEVHPRGRKSIRVLCELALSEPERTEGLMWRKKLPPRGGMLFRFPKMDFLAFWMKNTLIPLDMIFINDNHVVVGVVHRARPHDETPMGIRGVRSRYVLEVRGGFARRHGIKRGTSVSFSLP
jgi:uncharacterized membrane protein (UPF0127 family)